jgi:hypothetical protein
MRVIYKSKFAKHEKKLTVYMGLCSGFQEIFIKYGISLNARTIHLHLTVVTRWEDDSELWAVKDLKGDSRGLFHYSVLQLTWAE